MKVIRSREEILSFSNNCDKEIGIVPTMGNLHDGHLKLVEASLLNNEVTIVTIFVNPKQFGPNEDFEKYPRTLDEDISKISSLRELLKNNDNKENELIIFAPSSVEEVYPSNFNTTISVKGLDNRLCGLNRPGHFDGVCTVVYQLFALTKAKRAYFGLKDFQQTLIIRKLVKDLLLPVEIHLIDIIRDEDGLALSSRNKYLSAEERINALTLPKRIKNLEQLVKESGISEAMKKTKIYNEESNVDYFHILDSSNLSLASSDTCEVVIAGAMRFGNTRLIDNTLVKINA